METAIVLDKIIAESLNLNEQDLKQIPPLTLAYIGDAVYELAVRCHVLKGGAIKPGQLHAKSIELVCAQKQSAIFGQLESSLSEDELAVFKRARNAKGSHIPSHAKVGEYRRASGFEALIGYLYLKQEHQRLAEIFELILA